MRIAVSSLDFKLALRMLVRFPGLTLVGGVAIAFAIWVGAGAFEIIRQVALPDLPLEEGDRIVGIHHLDRSAARTRLPTLHDFAAWSAGVRSVGELGAFRLVERNLVPGDGEAEPVEVAEITASAFRVTRVPPLLGRPLVPADERPDAPPVAVIGYDVWQRRFEGDPEVVGREIRLGRAVHTVVGVMPRGYAFPVAQRLWVPLRLDPLAFAAGEAPRVRVFGRLAPGATLEQAQAELASVGRRAAADSPETHRHLLPEVLPYARSILNLPTLARIGLGTTNLFLVMLLVLVCGNVALLMFARAASREKDLVVRSALGASRGRLVAQLFAEALVLAAGGALLGLALVQLGLRWAFASLGANVPYLPFWLRPELSPSTLLYAGVLTVLAAAVAGVVPGMKVTRGLRARLQRASAGGGGFRFGGIWTAVIVAQIAVTLVFPMVAFLVRRDATQLRDAEMSFPEEEFLSVRVEMDGDPGAEGFGARYAATVRRLGERLAAEPGVKTVTFGERLPRMYHPHRIVELDEGGAAPLDPSLPGYRVSSASVAPDYFAAFDAPVEQGRGFASADLEPGARVVIVNRSFVERVLGGRNPIGRHLRHRDYEEWDDPTPEQIAREPWYEIVGVVEDLGLSLSGHDPKVAGFYHPVPTGGAYPGHLAVRLEGDPAGFASRLRSIATRLEPDLRLYDVRPLSEANTSELEFLSFWFWLTAAVSGVAMFLSLAGIYAVMSFTVAQRTREIGIRVALGGTAERVMGAIFRRPLRQVGLGILLGGGVGALLLSAVQGFEVTPASVLFLALYVAAMTCVCLAACVVPARRALRVEPTEALRSDG